MENDNYLEDELLDAEPEEENDEVSEGSTFDVGTVVKKSGKYICVPCGGPTELKEGDVFEQCVDCLSDEQKVMEEDPGLWEYLGDGEE